MGTRVVVEPAPGGQALAVPADGAAREALSDPRWGLGEALGEIEGRQQPVPTGENLVYARVLPDEPGLQKIEFESGFSKPTVKGEWQPCVGRCFAWRQGAWVKVWETQPIEMLFSALPIVADADGDGELEIAVLPFYDLLLLDARTGAIKDRCRFAEGRSYGYVGAHDLDGDGRLEFVVEADFAKHVDVLGYREGRLALLWQRPIEPDIRNPQKVLRAHPHPVGDVDGDGRLEVVTSIYGEAGDGRWHVAVYDGVAGTPKADLPGQALQGLVDVNADGVTELLTTGTDGAGIPRFGRLTVWRLRDGSPVPLWQLNEAAWETWEPPLPARTNSGATFARRDVLCRVTADGCRAVIRQPVPGAPERTALRVFTWGTDGFLPVMGLSGGRLSALAMDESGRLLVDVTTAPGQDDRLDAVAGVARAGGSKPRGGTPGPAIVVCPPGPDPRPTILVQGPGEEIVALQSGADATTPTERWRLPGRGQSVNWPHDCKGPVVADLRGDGGRQLLYATAAPGGAARLAAIDLDRRALWHADLPDIPGSPPVWNTGSILLWQAGHFTDPRAMDVLVTVRRSMMHSEETLLLSGRDGHPLWRRGRQISDRGVGGEPFALGDFDGDGLDDAASFHPSILYILKGLTGADVIARDATWPGVAAKPVYWGVPIAVDFARTGKPSIFFGTRRASMTGLVQGDGSLVWSDALDQSPKSLPAFGDVDGDGRIEALGWGYADGIRCYETDTGRVRWHLDPPVQGKAPAGCASADLNGDGRDEAVFTMGTTLCALGSKPEGKAGEVLWQVGLPATLGPPSIGMPDGDGRLAILVAGADGYVYCLR